MPPLHLAFHLREIFKHRRQIPLEYSRCCSRIGIRRNLTHTSGIIPPHTHLICCVFGHSHCNRAQLQQCSQSSVQITVSDCAVKACIDNCKWVWVLDNYAVHCIWCVCIKTSQWAKCDYEMANNRPVLCTLTVFTNPFQWNSVHCSQSLMVYK